MFRLTRQVELRTQEVGASDVSALVESLENVLVKYKGDQFEYDTDEGLFRFVITGFKWRWLRAFVLKWVPVLYIMMFGEIKIEVCGDGSGVGVGGVGGDGGVRLQAKLVSSEVMSIIMLLPFACYGICVAMYFVLSAGSGGSHLLDVMVIGMSGPVVIFAVAVYFIPAITLKKILTEAVAGVVELKMQKGEA